MNQTSKSWVGFALEGTLAVYHSGSDIGAPIPEMTDRINRLIAAGLRVKIFTPHAAVPARVAQVQSWLMAHHLPVMEITNRVDYDMLGLYDDRAFSVVMNKGEVVNNLDKFLFKDGR